MTSKPTRVNLGSIDKFYAQTLDKAIEVDSTEEVLSVYQVFSSSIGGGISDPDEGF